MAGQKHKIAFFTAALLFIIPFSYQVAWIYIFEHFDNHAGRVAKFKTLLPPFCKDPGNATWGFIGFFLAAMILFMISLKLKNRAIRVTSILLLVISALLTLLLLFSLL